MNKITTLWKLSEIIVSYFLIFFGDELSVIVSYSKIILLYKEIFCYL